MLIPEKIVDLNEVQTGIKPSLTLCIDFEKEKITEKIDNLKAVQQAVFLILISERNHSPIYENFGIKTVDLIGQDFPFVASELKRRITEALLEDDRVTGVNNFSYSRNEDCLTMMFDVYTIYGNFTATKEV